MTRTVTVAIVAAAAPLGAVLALTAIAAAAWADYRRPKRRVPWNLA